MLILVHEKHLSTWLSWSIHISPSNRTLPILVQRIVPTIRFNMPFLITKKACGRSPTSTLLSRRKRSGQKPLSSHIHPSSSYLSKIYMCCCISLSSHRLTIIQDCMSRIHHSLDMLSLILQEFYLQILKTVKMIEHVRPYKTYHIQAQECIIYIKLVSYLKWMIPWLLM